ncbi:MAG: hypothetical protein MHPSP_001398 [Paramarteilia canceri]
MPIGANTDCDIEARAELYLELIAKDREAETIFKRNNHLENTLSSLNAQYYDMQKQIKALEEKNQKYSKDVDYFHLKIKDKTYLADEYR